MTSAEKWIEEGLKPWMMDTEEKIKKLNKTLEETGMILKSIRPSEPQSGIVSPDTEANCETGRAVEHQGLELAQLRWEGLPDGAQPPAPEGALNTCRLEDFVELHAEVGAVSHDFVADGAPGGAEWIFHGVMRDWLRTRTRRK
jgi:hypothetical protein